MLKASSINPFAHFGRLISLKSGVDVGSSQGGLGGVISSQAHDDEKKRRGSASSGLKRPIRERAVSVIN